MAKYMVEKYCADGSIEVEWISMSSKRVCEYRKDEPLEVGEFIALWRTWRHRWKDTYKARMVGAQVRKGYEVVIRKGAKRAPFLAVVPWRKEHE